MLFYLLKYVNRHVEERVSKYEDYDKIIEYATYDERLGLSHWGVPGPDGDFGFGGHCFPKDLAALLHLTEKLGTINNVLSATQETNNNVRKNRDWEGMKGRAVT